MRTRIVAMLRWLLHLLEEPDPRLTRARTLVHWADMLTVRGEQVRGERKRHQVLNRLVVEYPDARTRDLAFLIERVLQESPTHGRIQ